jgi:hypothetical protein
MRLLLALALITAWAACAHAGGMNLTWGEGCWADNPQTVQTFACDTNTGSFPMTASFMPSRDWTELQVITAVVDLQVDSAALPDWWQICPSAACRSGSLSATADFNVAPGACTYAWPGSTPNLSFTWAGAPSCNGGTLAPNRGRLTVFFFVDAPSTVYQGTEYYAFRLTVDAQRSWGPTACPGCAVPVTIVLNEIKLYASLVDRITTPLSNTCLRWQAAGTTPCSATPVRNMTWGAIKSFYR